MPKPNRLFTNRWNKISHTWSTRNDEKRMKHTQTHWSNDWIVDLSFAIRSKRIYLIFFIASFSLCSIIEKFLMLFANVRYTKAEYHDNGTIRKLIFHQRSQNVDFYFSLLLATNVHIDASASISKRRSSLTVIPLNYIWNQHTKHIDSPPPDTNTHWNVKHTSK